MAERQRKAGIHLVKEMQRGAVTAKCGALSTTEHSTVWWRDVTCPDCLALMLS